MDEELRKLEEKLGTSTSYEALQYLQSFVARKKKALGPSKTSLCVFHGAKMLVNRGASGDAGALLVWFIESDELFHLTGAKKGGPKVIANGEEYCDTERILSLLTGLSPEKAGPVVDQIYGPLHQVATVAGLLRGAGGVSDRMEQFERLSADVFEHNKKWYEAYKVVMRLGNVERGARLLNSWSMEGNATEQPLYFGRAVMTLVADKKLSMAEDLIRRSTPFITDNVNPANPGGTSSGPLAVWHLAIILSGIASMPPMQRVDKSRLFQTLQQKYASVLDKTDPRLHELMIKVGSQTFAIALPQEMQNNPMAMFQKMMMASGGLGGGGAPSSSGGQQEPQIDMAAIMKHMKHLEMMNGK